MRPSTHTPPGLRLQRNLLLPAAPWLAALWLAACGSGTTTSPEGESTAPGAAETVQAAEQTPATLPKVTRSDDPRVVQAREALDMGRLDLAQALVPQAAAVAGDEAALLEARLAALSGDQMGALAQIEQARRRDPTDARVFATAAEIYAATGDLAEADRQIRMGVEAAGSAAPELVRARGVHLICTQGQARHGLALLIRARELDPGLPFIDRPLGQAHMLVAKEYLASGDKDKALASVRTALEHDPGDLDTRRLEAEILMLQGQWGGGIERYEALLLEGLPLGPELAGYCKNAGFWAVTHDQRQVGVGYYLRALELGYPRAELNHGQAILEEEASALAVEGARALADADLDLARAKLERALACDPDSLEAHNHMGHVLHSTGDIEGAVDEWNRVVDAARSLNVELPEPVHIKVARALALGLGRFQEASDILDAYLTLEPTGRWLEATRQLRAALGEPPVADDAGDDDREDGGQAR